MRALSAFSILSCAFVVAALATSPGQGAWPHSPSINVPLCTATNTQTFPSIVSDGAGGAIVAWQDARSGTNDIYAQHILASGSVDPAWPTDGRALCTAVNSQSSPMIAADGAGGAIVAWGDLRSGPADIYAQHVLASGAVDPAWPVDGRALCTAAITQSLPKIVADGAGGAIVTWQDLRGGATPDIYAQHVLASGAVDPAWPLDGRALCTAPNMQEFPDVIVGNSSITADGAGGAIVTWRDYRSGSYDIYAQRVLASGAVDPAWPLDGRGVCTASNFQIDPTVVSDGAGGAIITWSDLRSGSTYDNYAQHVLASGAVDPTWPLDGRALCTATGSQTPALIATDGAGGAIVVWNDTRAGVNTNDLYTQHVLASGAVDPAWPLDGRALCTATDGQTLRGIVPDGAGGAIVTWADSRSGTSDVYAHRILASGATDPAWPVDGRALCTATGGQPLGAIVGDGAGGAIVAWHDARSGTSDIYAQRVARFGYLGTPEPVIAGVRDVPNDNGGKLKLSWDASYLDTDSDPNLSAYEVYRSVPPNLATAALARGARLLASLAEAPELGAEAILTTVEGTTTVYWEHVATQSAVHYLAGYSYLASTAGDSTGSSNPTTFFMVVGRNAANTMYWLSPPDSGYSVDNLSPSAPAAFSAQYFPGSPPSTTRATSPGHTWLHWDPNAEPDFLEYRLHRGSSVDFVPGPENLLVAKPDTGYIDVGSAGGYYKLLAMDTHGNASVSAVLTPADIVGVGPTALPGVLSLAPPFPNPARGPTSLHFALPRAAPVSLAVFDAGGRRMRTLAAGQHPAGEYSIVWDLRDDSKGSVPSGLYFIRLAVGDLVLKNRLAVIRD